LELGRLLVRVGRDGEHQLLGVGRLERRTFDGHHAAVEAQGRRLADLQVKVGGVLIHHQLQQIVHFIAHGGGGLRRHRQS
jgi:hypothetical protein